MAQVCKRLRQLRRLKRRANAALRQAQRALIQAEGLALRERQAARRQLLEIIEQVKDTTLREAIQHELQTHEACQPAPDAVHRSDEVIGFHRGLHWVQKLLAFEEKDATRSSEARNRGMVECSDGLSPVSSGAVDGLPAGDRSAMPEVSAADDTRHP